MAAPIYATETDVERFTGSAYPADRTSRVDLREASALVAAALRNDWLAVDAVGIPVDANARDAVNDATCAQIETWIAADVDPIASPLAVLADDAVTSASLGSASYSAESGTAASSATAKADLAATLHLRAYRILRAAGLASRTIVAV